MVKLYMIEKVHKKMLTHNLTSTMVRRNRSVTLKFPKRARYSKKRMILLNFNYQRLNLITSQAATIVPNEVHFSRLKTLKEWLLKLEANHRHTRYQPNSFKESRALLKSKADLAHAVFSKSWNKMFQDLIAKRFIGLDMLRFVTWLIEVIFQSVLRSNLPDGTNIITTRYVLMIKTRKEKKIDIRKDMLSEDILNS